MAVHAEARPKWTQGVIPRAARRVLLQMSIEQAMPADWFAACRPRGVCDVLGPDDADGVVGGGLYRRYADFRRALVFDPTALGASVSIHFFAQSPIASTAAASSRPFFVRA